MMFGVALVVLGYAVFYWGLHHFVGVDCPNNENCRYSLTQVLGIDKYIGRGTPVAIK
jgi:hypothetical protein